ncbi:MAG TPA: DUF2213 domain-containing protein [Gaiellaceae bacterium]
MEAAAHGRSALGIPKSVGEEFVGKDADLGNGKFAAGVAYVAPDGDVLLLRRSSGEANFAGHWSLPGGGGDEGETPEQTARRESIEEMGDNVPEGRMRAMNRRKTPTGMVFHTFAQPVNEKFVPKLNGEHSGYAWAPLDMLPRPLHPAVEENLTKNLGAAADMAPEDWQSLRENFAKWTREEETEGEHAEDSLPAEIAALAKGWTEAGAPVALAMDWAANLDQHFPRYRPPGGVVAFDRESVRDYDVDGRLHVARANISKAAINPYKGSEIPDYDQIGLDPNRIYMLLRDPEELKKAAPTFNNLPLLDDHVAVSADDHKPERVVGALGSAATYEHPFLRNGLVVWARHGIDGVESEEQKEISCSYRYRADMTPGEYEGKHYDGVMRDIVGNHAALVKKGRAGSDVVVGDSSIEETKMAGKLTRMGVYTVGILAAALTPKLAKDAALDLSPILGKLEAGKTLKDSRPVIAAGLKGLKGLAKDANLDDVTALLDKLEKAEKVEGMDDLEPNSAPMMGAGQEQDEDAMDAAGGNGEAMNFLKGKGLSDDDCKAVMDMMRPKANDETPEEKAAREKEEADKKAADEAAAKEEKVDKKAMDAAIKLAVDGATKTATTSALKLANDIAGAREFVEPWVGKLASSLAFDSAEQVYEKTLTMLKVPTKDMHPSAFKHVLAAQPKPGADHRRTVVANDGAIDASGFAERFPGAGRIGVG